MQQEETPLPLDSLPSGGTRLTPSLKYSPDQPRVSAGNPDGGQWTSGGSSGGTASGGNVRVANRLKLFMELAKRLAGSNAAKLPKFLTKRPAAGKIVGKLEDLTPAEKTLQKR